MLKLIIGGTASGKSEYAETEAEKLCVESGKPLLYIASLKSRNDGTDAKIKKHRERRERLEHITEECFDPGSLRESVKKTGKDRVILFDSLDSFLACNTDIIGKVDLAGNIVDIIKCAAEITDIIVVADAVFSDGVLYDDFTMEYIAVLGGILRELALFADNVTEVVCGIPVEI